MGVQIVQVETVDQGLLHLFVQDQVTVGVDISAVITERRRHVTVDIDGLAVLAVAGEVRDVVFAIECLARRTTASSARSIIRLETNHSGILSLLCGVFGWQKWSGIAAPPRAVRGDE
jgi:ABC-type uncharacterized transport system ATPase subunit